MNKWHIGGGGGDDRAGVNVIGRFVGWAVMNEFVNMKLTAM